MRKPDGDASGYKDNQRSRVERHATILWVFFPQQLNGATLSLSSVDDASRTRNEHVRQFAPVLLVVINDERDLRIRFDVAQALELGGGAAFWLFVNGRVEVFAVEGEADGNHVRLTGAIGRGEVSNASRADEA